LRENQTDQDTLPPYEILDAILEQYVEQGRCPEEIVAMGFERATVERIAKMVRQNEYKRKQAAIGLKVTSKAFGTGRRFPIAAKYL
jgi:NH3-dependent NAD+ synthetase